MNAPMLALLAGRMMACCICLAGAVWLAHDDKAGWGWLIFAAILLGGITYSSTKDGGQTND